MSAALASHNPFLATDAKHRTANCSGSVYAKSPTRSSTNEIKASGGGQLAGGPLVDDDAEVVELLDGDLDVAADGGALFAVGEG